MSLTSTAMIRRPNPNGANGAHGEDLIPRLPDSGKVRFVLENGTGATLDIAAELAIPRHGDALVRAAETAHARLAFWDHQTERALAAVRRQEQVVDQLESREQLVWRKWYEDNMVERATNDEVRARTSLETDVQSARNTLTDLQERYGVLRAVRDALVHRAHLLRRLVAAEDHRE